MENKIEGDVIDLFNKSAIDKIKEITMSSETCMFISELNKIPLSVRPMYTLQVDDEGYIWFFSGRTTKKNIDISKDPRVQLIYSNPANFEYLTVYGHAQITENRNDIERLWNPIVKTWFKDGKEDQELTLIKVKPEEAFYWDTKNNRAISMLKMAASSVTGITMDDGVQGKLEIE